MDQPHPDLTGKEDISFSQIRINDGLSYRQSHWQVHRCIKDALDVDGPQLKIHVICNGKRMSSYDTLHVHPKERICFLH